MVALAEADDRSEAADTAIVQIIYASAARAPFTAVQLRELLGKARANNTAQGISGMLVYHTGSFLQVLEGPEDAVAALFERIDKDPRHTGMKLLFRDRVPEREFADWSMGFIDAGDGAAPEGFVDYLSELKALTIGKTRAGKVLAMFQEGTWRQKAGR